MAYTVSDFQDALTRVFGDEYADEHIRLKISVSQYNDDDVLIEFGHHIIRQVLFSKESESQLSTLLALLGLSGADFSITEKPINSEDIEYMESDEYNNGYYYNKFTGKIIE